MVLFFCCCSACVVSSLSLLIPKRSAYARNVLLSRKFTIWPQKTVSDDLLYTFIAFYNFVGIHASLSVIICRLWTVEYKLRAFTRTHPIDIGTQWTFSDFVYAFALRILLIFPVAHPRTFGSLHSCAVQKSWRKMHEIETHLNTLSWLNSANAERILPIESPDNHHNDRISILLFLLSD